MSEQPEKPTILIIDADPDIVTIYAYVLKEIGMILSTGLGKEGLRLFEANRDKIKVIITAQALPDLSGSDVCRSLISQYKSLPPIILISGLHDLDAEMQGLVSAYLPKPYLPPVLIKTVNQALAGELPAVGEAFVKVDSEFGTPDEETMAIAAKLLGYRPLR